MLRASITAWTSTTTFSTSESFHMTEKGNCPRIIHIFCSGYSLLHLFSSHKGKLQCFLVLFIVHSPNPRAAKYKWTASVIFHATFSNYWMFFRISIMMILKMTDDRGAVRTRISVFVFCSLTSSRRVSQCQRLKPSYYFLVPSYYFPC